MKDWFVSFLEMSASVLLCRESRTATNDRFPPIPAIQLDQVIVFKAAIRGNASIC